MADSSIGKTVTLFSNDEFEVFETITIYPNGGVDRNGNPVDVVKRSSGATVRKPPSGAYGPVGVLLGSATSQGRVKYYVVLTGIKSKGPALTDAEMQAGALCRDPIAVYGNSFDAVTTALHPLFSGPLSDSNMLEIDERVRVLREAGHFGPFDQIDGRASNPDLVFPPGPRPTREECQAKVAEIPAWPPSAERDHYSIWLNLYLQRDKWAAIGAASTPERRAELNRQLDSIPRVVPATSENLAVPPDALPLVFPMMQMAWQAKGYPWK